MISPSVMAAFQSAVAQRTQSLMAATTRPQQTAKGTPTKRPAKATATGKPATSGTPKPTTGVKPLTPVARAKSTDQFALDPEITPYLEASDLMAVGDRVSAYKDRLAQMEEGFSNQAISAFRANQDIERGRIANNEGIANNMAARGLQRSSIRDGALRTSDDDAARAVGRNQDDVSIAGDKFVSDDARLKRGNAAFMAAITARAAENARSIHVGPDPVDQAAAQRKAGNTKGARTIRRTKKAKARP